MPAKNIDAFLAHLDPDKSALLSNVRKTIHEACPKAVELISWGVPFFKYEGKYLIGLNAFKNHCDLAAWDLSPAAIEKHGIDLSKYDTTKALIRFTPAKPLPASLIKRIVKLRMKEIDIELKMKGK
ncbi:MAG: DUF1801 domain-containing protein [Flavobacteriales bacterium]